VNDKRKVAGYVKLAKLWERSKEKAIAFQHRYYEEKYADDEEFELVGVYIDITGQKEIAKRPQMLQLMHDCALGKVDVIAAQTKGYLAANTGEFSYLVKFLFDLDPPIDLITEEEAYQIDTISNPENQREALQAMVDKIVAMNPTEYVLWLKEIRHGMHKLGLK